MLSRSFVSVLMIVGISACGGGSGSSGGSSAENNIGNDPNAGNGQVYTVGGTITGLNGELDLRNESTNELITVAANSFEFNQGVFDGNGFRISIESEPDQQQICRLNNSEGTIAQAAVSDIEIDCIQWFTSESVVSASTNHTFNLALDPHLANSGSKIEAVFYTTESMGSDTFDQTSRNSYDPDTGWGNASQVNMALTPGRFRNMASVINADGDEMLAYLDTSSSENRLYAMNTLGYGNTNDSTIDDADASAGSVSNFDMDIDTDGNVIIVWQQYDANGKESIYANYFDGSWGTATKIESDNTDDAYSPVVAFTSTGQAIAAWSQDNTISGSGAGRSIYWSEFTADNSTQWDVPTELDSLSGGSSNAAESDTRILVTDSGKVMLTWSQGNGDFQNFEQNIYTAFYDGSTWSSPLIVDDQLSAASRPNMANIANNQVALVWRHTKPYASICSVTDQTCESPKKLENINVQAVDVAADPQGNIVAAYLGLDSGNIKQVYSHRFDANTKTWSSSKQLTNGAVNAGVPLVEQVEGDFVVVWVSNQANRLESMVLAEPINTSSDGPIKVAAQ